MKKIILLSFFALALTTSCKKATKTPDSAPVAQTPVTPDYSTLSTTIAVIDYTAPTGALSIYSTNLSPTTTAIAYVVADGVKIDSLSLLITKTADGPPTGSLTPCDSPYWNSYVLNTKGFKVKNNATNVLKVYEDGNLVSSVPIVVDVPSASATYAFSGIFSSTSPLVNGYPCQEGKRLRVIQ